MNFEYLKQAAETANKCRYCTIELGLHSFLVTYRMGDYRITRQVGYWEFEEAKINLLELAIEKCQEELMKKDGSVE